MTPDRFFGQLVPEAWNRRLAAQSPERQASLREVEFALEIRVEGGDPCRFHLQVKRGEMQLIEEATADPFARLILELDDFSALAEQMGPEPLALLTGVGGDSEFALTAARIQALGALHGSIAVRITGANPWSVTVHYGPEPVSDPADTTISIPHDAYTRLRSGDLDLQGAFLGGQLTLDGNLDLAMKMAMALMS